MKKQEFSGGVSQAVSGIGSSSKSPGGKIKKRGQAGLDKEAKDALKNMDNKIEDLRKQVFGNINRVEAKLDDLQTEMYES